MSGMKDDQCQITKRRRLCFPPLKIPSHIVVPCHDSDDTTTIHDSADSASTESGTTADSSSTIMEKSADSESTERGNTSDSASTVSGDTVPFYADRHVRFSHTVKPHDGLSATSQCIQDLFVMHVSRQFDEFTRLATSVYDEDDMVFALHHFRHLLRCVTSSSHLKDTDTKNKKKNTDVARFALLPSGGGKSYIVRQHSKSDIRELQDIIQALQRILVPTCAILASVASRRKRTRSL